MKAILVSGKKDFDAVQYNDKRFAKGIEVEVNEDEKAFLEDLKGYKFEFSDGKSSVSAESEVHVASDEGVDLAPANIDAAAELAASDTVGASRASRRTNT